MGPSTANTPLHSITVGGLNQASQERSSQKTYLFHYTLELALVYSAK
jgi:hypothetical protein